jgi:hypothetical protein
VGHQPPGTAEVHRHVIHLAPFVPGRGSILLQDAELLFIGHADLRR